MRKYQASSSALSAPLPASIGHRLLHHPLGRVALDDTLLDGLLPLRPFGEDAVHVDVAPLTDAQHAADGLLLVGGGVDAVGVVAPERRVRCIANSAGAGEKWGAACGRAGASAVAGPSYIPKDPAAAIAPAIRVAL